MRTCTFTVFQNVKMAATSRCRRISQQEIKSSHSENLYMLDFYHRYNGQFFSVQEVGRISSQFFGGGRALISFIYYLD